MNLALAGICALAFISVADAGSALRMNAKVIKQGNSQVVGTSNINIKSVTTNFSTAGSAQQYLKDIGKYDVTSMFTNSLLI